MWIYVIADLASLWFGIAILMLVWMFIPEGQDSAWLNAIESWDPSSPMEIPLLILRTVVLCVMLAMSLADVFVTGAGFGIYLNNRTWLEGWDVELAFRRLAARIGGVALMIIIMCCAWMPANIRAGETRDPAEVIREVKADEAFKIHKVTQRIPKQRENRWTWDLSGAGGVLALLGQIVMWMLAAALLASLIWMLWINRHVLRLGAGGKATSAARKARVVMGMDVSPETLPADIPAAAMALWRQGRHHEALGLLYRGAISRIIETAGVDIHESDTEGDCLRRVEEAGSAARPDYFRGITGAWMRLAYARRDPDEAEVEALCRQWPFAERREA